MVKIIGLVGGSAEGGRWWWWWWCVAAVWWCVVLVQPCRAYSSTYLASDFSKNVTLLLDNLLANYDPRIRPGHGGKPTLIMVNMNVRSMGPFSEKQESYAMQLYLRQMWFDPRLRFNRTELRKPELSMNWKFADRLWKPDTYFINGKNSYAHKITAPNTFIRLQHDGQITWSLRLTVRASCKMHLRKFPLDTQICPLSLASYGYNSNDMVYKWAKADKVVTVASDVSIAQYELFNTTIASGMKTVKRKEIISMLEVKFHLKRLTGFFLLQVYVPCILIVCCSWVAFWITKKDVPGRVCLGVTTILALTKTGFISRPAMPKLSYQTGLDYFILLCFTYVFGAIVEYAMIIFFERTANRRRKKMEDMMKTLEELAKARLSVKDVLNNMNEAEGTTMMVTTTVTEDGGVDIGTSLRDAMRVPLSVVPLSVRPIEEEEEEIDTQATLRETLKIPLATIVPESVRVVQEGEAMRQPLELHEGMVKGGGGAKMGSSATSPVKDGVDDEEDSGGDGSGIDTSVVSGEIDPMLSRREAQMSGSDSGSVTSKGSMFKFKKDSISKNKEKSKGSESDLTVIKVDIQSEEDEQPPLPPPFTVWQILTRKRKIMSEMTAINTIPTEEDLLERFSIIDLYARRLFPSSFFILFTIYWVLFNYYITDEFPHEQKTPSSGGSGQKIF